MQMKRKKREKKTEFQFQKNSFQILYMQGQASANILGL